MDYKLHARLATMAASFVEVCKEFSMTEEQIAHPDAGKVIVDRIHQIQTAYNMRKGILDSPGYPKLAEEGK